MYLNNNELYVNDRGQMFVGIMGFTIRVSNSNIKVYDDRGIDETLEVFGVDEPENTLANFEFAVAWCRKSGG